jgi:nitrous oxidase accessory protein
MNKNIILTLIVLMFFSSWLNSALAYASFNKTPDAYPKSVVAISNTIWVPDNYTTIQEAINNANEGETILIKAGTYYEHVIVNKPLLLVGENKQNTTIDGSGTETVVYVIANNVTLSGFTIQNGEQGIYLRYSSNNVVSGNNVSSNGYGIYLWGSSHNVVSGNDASNNDYGIYLEGSSHNTLTSNNVSNNGYGTRLYHSDNNVVSGNDASNNDYGIYVGDSGSTRISGNDASNNDYGIYLSYTENNVVSGNNVSSNGYGIYLWGSSHNVIFQNNFISYTEPIRSIGSVNSWDNGVEGNYWSGYHGTDADWDGIGDTPYHIDINNQDNYPLIATFLQFNIMAENQSYKIAAVCNSTISNFQCHYIPSAKANAVSFKVNFTENKGFCRISIPNSLIDPPFTVKVDNRPPLYFKKVYANRTHTWLYFTYSPLEHEITIMHTSPSEQLLWYQLAIFGLAIIILILFPISINYYRLFNKQKKVIKAYEREVGSFPVSHEERARMHFIKDVIEREEKLEKFKKKYGIKIHPASTLEDLMEKLGVQKES